MYGNFCIDIGHNVVRTLTSMVNKFLDRFSGMDANYLKLLKILSKFSKVSTMFLIPEFVENVWTFFVDICHNVVRTLTSMDNKFYNQFSGMDANYSKLLKILSKFRKVWTIFLKPGFVKNVWTFFVDICHNIVHTLTSMENRFFIWFSVINVWTLIS